MMKNSWVLEARKTRKKLAKRSKTKRLRRTLRKV